MKILMISGSRNADGQTARAADALLDGAASAGAEVERVFLPALNIERCRQCNEAGWGTCRPEGRCVVDDDFAGIVEQIRAADAAVFANPVYYGDLSESLRAFTDRLRRTCMHKDGSAGIDGTPAIGVCGRRWRWRRAKLLRQHGEGAVALRLRHRRPRRCATSEPGREVPTAPHRRRMARDRAHIGLMHVTARREIRRTLDRTDEPR